MANTAVKAVDPTPPASASTPTESAESKAPPETKAERFVRLANLRAGNAIDAMRNLENLSNKAQYEYSAEQVNIILQKLTESVKRVAASFSNPSAVSRAKTTVL